jgi:hypothetical protein
MGRPDEQRGKQTLAVAVDIEGNANYDAIVRQGARANKVIHTGHQALIPKLDLMEPSVSDYHTRRINTDRGRQQEQQSAPCAQLSAGIDSAQAKPAPAAGSLPAGL